MPNNIYIYRKRTFLDPVSTNHTSYIHAHVESTREGEYKFGDNMLYIADCHRQIELEFFLGTKHARKLSLRKINLLIAILMRFRDALAKEIELIEKFK